MAERSDGALGGALVEDLERAFLAVDRDAVSRALEAAASRLGAPGALEAVLVPALERVGERWAAGDASLSQVYMAGRFAESFSAALLPAAAGPHAGIRVGVAVLEDQHLLGKRIVLAHLRAAGLAPVDLGHGMSAPALARQAGEERLDVLLVSALTLRAALACRELVAELRRAGAATRLAVGGAPFRMDPELWRRVGADACGATAAEAAPLALALGRRR